MKNPLAFTELLREIQATYPGEPRKYHILATRYYQGTESVQSLRALATQQSDWGRPVLTIDQVEQIIRNR